LPVERVRRGEALSKGEFHRHLRTWLDSTDDAIVGPDDVPGVTPWMYIRDGSSLFELHADTTCGAVRDYLGLVDVHGDIRQWAITASDRGNMTAVLYGPKQIRLKPFYLYATRTAAE